MLKSVAPYRPDIEKIIADFCDQKLLSLDKKSPESVREVFIYIKQLSVKGKMLRALLVILLHDATGGKNRESAIVAAAAVELFHAGLLIHDDIIDNDHKRRGMETIHETFRKKVSEPDNTSAINYGRNLGICAGDTAFFLSFELLSSINTGSVQLSEILSTVSSELTGVTRGQMLDIENSSGCGPVTTENILRCYELKTARYTFGLPLVLGALIAGRHETNLITDLWKMGTALGMAYQLKDDDLGIFGDPDVTGKPVGSDVRENKMTYHRVLLGSAISASEKIRINKIFGNKTISDNDVGYVREMLIKKRIRQQIDTKISEYVREAQSILPTLNLPEKYQKDLENLIDFVANRNK